MQCIPKTSCRDPRSLPKQELAGSEVHAHLPDVLSKEFEVIEITVNITNNVHWRLQKPQEVRSERPPLPSQTIAKSVANLEE